MAGTFSGQSYPCTARPMTTSGTGRHLDHAGQCTQPPLENRDRGILTSLLQEKLIEFLYTDEIVKIGVLSTRCKASYLSQRLLHTSVIETGPSDATRFHFWKKALNVSSVQRRLLADFEDDVCEDGDFLDEAGFHVFTRVLFSSCLKQRERGKEEGSKGDETDRSGYENQGVDHGCIQCSSLGSTAHGCHQQRYSGKRMLAAEGQEGEILRDVARTFPLEPLFRDSAGVGQNLLANVLKACLSFHEDTGYMQGMNYVVACFLFALRRRLLSPSSSMESHPQTCITPPEPTHDHSKRRFAPGESSSNLAIAATSAQHYKSYCPLTPDAGGRLASEISQHFQNHHHLDGASTPTAVTEEVDGYLSDASIQTQGSECFSPPRLVCGHLHPHACQLHQHYPLRGPPAKACDVHANHPSPVAMPSAMTGVSHVDSRDLTHGSRAEKTALAKKHGFMWECTEEHMHVASDVFWLMTALMSSSGLSMRLLWHPQVPEMKLRVFQFDRLLARHLPRLHAHFRQIQLVPDILVTQWHMTLLAYCLPLPVLARVWDLVFLDGWKALFRVTLALLHAVEEELLPLNLGESGSFLRQWTSRRHPLWSDASGLLRAAHKWKVTRSMLGRLKEDFHLTLLAEQMTGHNMGEWLNRYGPPGKSAVDLFLPYPELERLKREINLIEVPFTEDLTHYRRRIEEASQACEAAEKWVVDLEGQMKHAVVELEELEEVYAVLQDPRQRHLPSQLPRKQEKVEELAVEPQAPRLWGRKERKQSEKDGTSSSHAFSKLLSVHRKELVRPGDAPPPSPIETASFASSLISSIRDLRIGPQRVGRSSLTVLGDARAERSRTNSSARARTSTADSIPSSTPSSSPSSPRLGSMDAALTTKMPPEIIVSLDGSAHKHTETMPGSGNGVGLRTNRSSSIGQKQAGCRTEDGEEDAAPLKGMRISELHVHIRKLSRADAQLASLRARCGALQRKRREAEEAREEAETLRAALSDQLFQLLEESERKRNRKLREVVRNLPASPHAAQPLALLPNLSVLESGRHVLQESRRRAESLVKRKTCIL